MGAAWSVVLLIKHRVKWHSRAAAGLGYKSQSLNPWETMCSNQSNLNVKMCVRSPVNCGHFSTGHWSLAVGHEEEGLWLSCEQPVLQIGSVLERLRDLVGKIMLLTDPWRSQI